MSLENSTERIRGVLLASLVISTLFVGSIALSSSASAATSPEPIDVIDVADKRPGELTTLTASFETVDGSTFQISFSDGGSDRTSTNGFGSVVQENVAFDIYTDGDPSGEPERTASTSGITTPDDRTLQVDLDDSVDFNDGDVVQIVVENFRTPAKRGDYDASIIPTDGQPFDTEGSSRADRLNIVGTGGSDTAGAEVVIVDVSVILN